MPLIYVEPDRFTDKPLHLVPCLIGGEVAMGDYNVLCDGLRVGRIMRVKKSFGRVSWDWTITGPVMPSEMGSSYGSTSSKEDAKAAVRVVFNRWWIYFNAQGENAAWLE